MITRRSLLLGGSAVLPAMAALGAIKHLKVDGEWCFIGSPARKTNRAVMILDGNGTTVDAESSSWEKNAACSALSQGLLSEGFLVAQSNRTATADNGMWGNEASQRSILALMSLLREDYGIRRFSAITVSAGGATLLNLLLGGRCAFASAALFSPVISLESMYRCPGGSDRVKGIATAYGFQPLRECPGDAVNDAAFRRATEGFDPMRRIRSGVPRDWAGARTSWMVLYHQGDPKVLAKENGAPFVHFLRESGAAVKEIAIEGNTHNSDDLMRDYRSETLHLMSTPK